PMAGMPSIPPVSDLPAGSRMADLRVPALRLARDRHDLATDTRPRPVHPFRVCGCLFSRAVPQGAPPPFAAGAQRKARHRIGPRWKRQKTVVWSNAVLHTPAFLPASPFRAFCCRFTIRAGQREAMLKLTLLFSPFSSVRRNLEMSVLRIS